jgi:hypothetical protein
MRYDHAVLSREVLEAMNGILERKLQAEKAGRGEAPPPCFRSFPE